MIRLAKRSIFAAVAVLVAAGCHSDVPPTHYYAAGDNWAIYLAWTEDATGHLQGQIQVLGADPNDPAKMRTLNGAFTGTRNGQDISISFPLLSNYLGATWTGTLSNNEISLVIPTAGLPANPTLVAGSFQDFQKAAQKVQAQVDSAAQEQARQAAIAEQQREAAAAAAAQQYRLNQQKSAAYNGAVDAQNHARDAYSQVQNALAELERAFQAPPPPGGLRSQYAAKWQDMLATWAKEQQEAQVSPMTCYHKSEIAYIGSEVAYKNSEIKYLDSESTSLLGNAQTAFNSTRQALDALDQWSSEYYRQAQTYSQLGGQGLSVVDPNAGVARFRKDSEKRLGTISERVDSFEATVRDYDEKAQVLQDRAQSFPQTIPCSG